MNIIDKYLCKAMDAYPYNLEETIESLDYALSYNAENAAALCLYGKVYAEQLKDFRTGKAYYRQALAADMGSLDVYPGFIQLLIDYDEDVEAEKLIQYAMRVKGICKAQITTKLIMLKEKQRNFKEVSKQLKELKLIVLNSDYDGFIKETEKRVKEKKSMLKK